MKVDALTKGTEMTHVAAAVQRRGIERAGFEDLRASAAVQRKLMQVAQRAGKDEEEPAQRVVIEDEEAPHKALSKPA